ncbi:MAG: metal-dependent hydrolase [Candidatus Micrarchaeota archaeon]|nr:metal-dependent hydrolase [Candidatus Micrarchaeota archaeon]
MNHFGHMVVGGIVGLVAMLILKEFSLPLVAICLLGSILPDIDLKQSKASQIVQPIAVLGVAFLLYPFFSTKFGALAAVVVSLAISAAVIFLVLFPLRLKHRGITHSWKAAAVFSIIGGLLLGINGGIIALLSYASHLVVDRI